MKKPVVLIIMDGFDNPANTEMLFSSKHTNLIDYFLKILLLISASGMDVGVPDGQMGNSGSHTNIGAGKLFIRAYVSQEH